MWQDIQTKVANSEKKKRSYPVKTREQVLKWKIAELFIKEYFKNPMGIQLIS